MIILQNKKWGGVLLRSRKEASTGLVLSPRLLMRGGQRQNKGGDSRG